MTCACKLLLPNNDPSTRESDPQVIIFFLLCSKFSKESSNYSDSQTTKLSLIDFFKYFFGNISKIFLIEFFNTISRITILRTGSGCVEDLSSLAGARTRASLLQHADFTISVYGNSSNYFSTSFSLLFFLFPFNCVFHVGWLRNSILKISRNTKFGWNYFEMSRK